MGFSIDNSVTQSHTRTHKIFLISNYFLLGTASSCIFLTLSLRLFPSLFGFFLILLHAITIVGAISGCFVAVSCSNRCCAAPMVLTSIFQLPRLRFGSHLDPNFRFLGVLEILREGGRWGFDIEIGRRALRGMARFGTWFCVEVLCSLLLIS
ncbi:uncharacterized protein LOC120197595 [Hibiscus syriacus]|uniref:uncharacterized protein LOC120197595 n=1 Tax=Hibiscus syriacus TaxID=106335 RepID=UPI00192397B7|nr:uncharacterized protein LOC120197595 [Hibiscus syriacus]